MNRERLAAKLEQIEEQARLTLEEFPQHLTRERLRMIIALARYMKSELSRDSSAVEVSIEA
jgi:hypothetical protein